MFTFEWDEEKEKANFRKHKVTFAEAETVFTDELLVTFPDEIHSDEEERFISIGMSEINRLLLVVHTEIVKTSGNITIRIISCRKATPLERKTYEENY